jgi:hypothetical protein
MTTAISCRNLSQRTRLLSSIEQQVKDERNTKKKQKNVGILAAKVPTRSLYSSAENNVTTRVRETSINSTHEIIVVGLNSNNNVNHNKNNGNDKHTDNNQ